MKSDPGQAGYLRKIKSADNIEEVLERHRRKRAVIVQCHGAFDNLHLGHLRHLAWAKSQGDLLIASISAGGSDPGAPTFSPPEVRAEQLAAIAVVDYVVVDEGDWVGELIERVRPQIYVKGREFEDVHDGPFGRERRLVEKLGGEVRFSSGDVTYSAAGVLEARRRRSQPILSTTRKFCQKHGITADSMRELLENAAGKKILVLGETIVDEYVHCDAIGMSADAPTIVVRPSHQDKFLGGAGIVAQHAFSLGAASRFVSVVGDDFEADYVRSQLMKRELTHDLVVDRSRPTIHKKRYLVDGRKMLNVNTFRDQAVSHAVEARLSELVKKHGADADAIVISDFSYGVVTERVIDEIRAIGAERGIPVIGDVQTSSQIGMVSRLKGITLSTPSEREARLAVFDRESGLADIGVRLLRETGNRSLLITLGHRGCMIFDTGGRDWAEIAKNDRSHEIKRNLTIEYLPSLGGHVVDPMGAGDAMLATVALTLAAGGSLLQAAFLGSCSSAIAISNMGNIPVKRSELLAKLDEQLKADAEDETRASAEPDEGQA